MFRNIYILNKIKVLNAIYVLYLLVNFDFKYVGGSCEILFGKKSNFFCNSEVDRLVNKRNQQKQSRFYLYLQRGGPVKYVIFSEMCNRSSSQR